MNATTRRSPVRAQAHFPGFTAAMDQMRRTLWRAFQRGELSEDEFADRLEDLDPTRSRAPVPLIRRPSS